LTNTFDGFDMTMLEIHNPGVHAHIVGLFGDDILESHVLGMRKPTRAAFVAAADHFGVRLERILFIDDYATNCDGATAAGLTSIHSEPGQEEPAQQRVRQLLGLV
jgi:FMN phosphatase YigB (HAD superfamily)